MDSFVYFFSSLIHFILCFLNPTTGFVGGCWCEPSLLLSLSVQSLFFEAQETSQTDTWEGISGFRVPHSSKMVNVHCPAPQWHCPHKVCEILGSQQPFTLTPVRNVRYTALATLLCSFLFYYKMHTPTIQRRKKEKQKLAVYISASCSSNTVHVTWQCCCAVFTC